MRSFFSMLLLLTLASCSTEESAAIGQKTKSLENLSPELACRPIPIRREASCAELQRLVDSWLSCTARCHDEDDCTVMPVPASFCRNWCEHTAGVGAASKYLDALGAALEARGCQSAGCACLRPPSAAVCRAGRCAAAE